MAHQNSESHIKLRAVIAADAELLFRWVNDPADRTNSRDGKPVSWEEHLAWFQRRLARSAPDIFIAMSDGTPVATFRVDESEISYYVAAEFRKRGYAKAMLTMARELYGVLTAEIFEENTASIRAARSAGFMVRIIKRT